MNLVLLALMSVGQLYCEAPASVTYYSGAHPDQIGVTYYHETPTVYAEVPLLWSQPNSTAVPVYGGVGYQATGPGEWVYCPTHNRWTRWQQVVTSDGQVAYQGVAGPGYSVSTPYVQSAPVATYQSLPVTTYYSRRGIFGLRRRSGYTTTYQGSVGLAPRWGGYTRAGNCTNGYCR